MIDSQIYLAGTCTAVGTAMGWCFRWLHKRQQVVLSEQVGAQAQMVKLWEFIAVQERKIATQQEQISELQLQLAQSALAREKDHSRILEQDAKIVEQGKQIESLQSEVDELLVKGGAAPKYRKSQPMQVMT